MGRLALILVLVLLGNTAFAIEDTVENRNKEADRYVSISPPKEMLHDMAEQMARNYPPEKREEFVKIMTQYFDIEAFTKTMKNLMVTIFTADELAEMAAFYGSPTGISATRKMGTYMAEILPSIQAEVSKAVAKANKDIRGSEDKQKAEVVN